MRLMRLRYLFRRPCKRCPYKLGNVKFFIDPCGHCKKNGYEMFKHFKEWGVTGVPITEGREAV